MFEWPMPGPPTLAEPLGPYFKGSNVLVTGVSVPGIATQLAKRLIEMGANVFMTGPEATEMVTELVSLKAKFFACDFADQSQLAALAGEVKAWLDGDPLDHVFHVAGWTVNKPFGESLPAAHRIMEINFHAPMALTELLSGDLSASTVCFTGSVQSQRVFPGHAFYAASKAATDVAVQHLAVELAARQQARVFGVAPGWTLVGRDIEGGTDWREAAKHMPSGRLVHTDDVVNAMLFLASPFGQFFYGHTFVVDGGQTLFHQTGVARVEFPSAK